MMMCYHQRTDDLSTTKRMRIALSSRIDSYSGNTTETGSVKYYQVLIPKPLVHEVFRNIHGEFGKHPGITKTTIAYREKQYYPNMARKIRE